MQVAVYATTGHCSRKRTASSAGCISQNYVTISYIGC